MKSLLTSFPILLLLAAGHCSAQAPATGGDTLSTFPGGDSAFEKYITDNLLSTREALNGHINGIVELSFVIDEKGYAGDISVMKRLGYGCDQQATRLLRNMPRWQPGVIAGRRIKTTLQHSFRFSDAMQAGETNSMVTPAMLPNTPLQFGQKEEDLAAYIDQHFAWPEKAPKNMPGAVTLQFKINEDGVPCDIQVVTGVGAGFDEAVINLVKNMPPWSVKRVDFRPTASYKELTIGFKNRKALLL